MEGYPSRRRGAAGGPGAPSGSQAAHRRAVLLPEVPGDRPRADPQLWPGRCGQHYWPDSYDQLVSWYQNADFFLLPSTPGLESFGMVVVESLACGTPVVALKAEGGGPNEIVTHGEDGFLVHADQIGRTLLQALEQPEAMARMRLAARRKAVEQYSIGVTQSAFFDIVSEATHP
ncbi:MAG: glycosyltransferase [Chloroflexi bacterium]|nr:glycosyltransferase [Chloroflexota bacterium]